MLVAQQNSTNKFSVPEAFLNFLIDCQCMEKEIARIQEEEEGEGYYAITSTCACERTRLVSRGVN